MGFLIALLRTKNPVTKIFIHRSVIEVIGSLSLAHLPYRGLVKGMPSWLYHHVILFKGSRWFVVGSCLPLPGVMGMG